MDEAKLTTDSLGKPGSKEAARLVREIGRRRTFAIISHPDAGKTTLTEKLLLFGGAIHLAGSVKARRADRHATSDWMDMERERGISITSSVLSFDYQGFRINLLDTPGHQDFSEDTYRALTAADSAVMLLDNRKGVEEQTRKLFSVCRKRRLPIVTLVNKCDRVGEDPFGLMDDVQTHLGIPCYPLTWPVRREGRLIGVCDRQSGQILLYTATQDHGQTLPPATVLSLDDPALEKALEPSVLEPLREELELLTEAGEAADPEAVSRGEATPVFFGSALTNFGLDVFFRHFLEMAPPPGQVDRQPGTRDPREGPLLRVHLQGAGEHEPEAPRPGRLPEGVLRAFRGRGGGHRLSHGENPAPGPASGTACRREIPRRRGRGRRRGGVTRPGESQGRRHGHLGSGSGVSPGCPDSPLSTSLRYAWRINFVESTWIGVSGIWPRKGPSSFSSPIPSAGPFPSWGPWVASSSRFWWPA